MTVSKNKDLKQTYTIGRKFGQIFTGQRIALHESGKLLLCPCYNLLNFIDVSTGKTIHEVRCSDDVEAEDYIVTFDYKDDRLIIVYNSGLLRQWSVEVAFLHEMAIEATLMRTWKSQHVGPVAKVLLDTSNTLVATGGSDSSIKIWDIINNYCTHYFKDVHGVISTVVFSPSITEDTYHLLASGDDYLIHVWNLIDSKHLATLSGHQAKVTSIVFTEDRERFISASRDKLAIVWNVANLEKERTIAIFESIEDVQLLSSNQLRLFDEKISTVMITAGESGLLKVWNYQTGNLLYSQQDSLLKVNAVESEEESKTEYTLISQLIYNQTGSELIAVSFDKDIIFHGIEDLKPKKQLIGHYDEVLDLKFIGEEQKHIAVATNSPKIKVFNLDTMNSYILVGHSDIVLCITVFPQNSLLMASCSKDNTVRVWQFNSDCSAATCILTGSGHTHSVTSLATSMLQSKQLFFLSGSEDTTLKYWKLPNDFNDSKQVIVAKFTQSCHEKVINSIDVSPNNQLVATGSQDKTAKLWLLPNLKLTGVLRGHKKGIWHVQFSPVDQILATCSADTTVKIWSITSNACLKTFQGHTSSVLKLHFIDEGMQLLTSASDGNLKIWNLKSNECVSTFDAHEGKVWAFAKSNDEETLVTGGDDSTIAVWKNITTEMREKVAAESEQQIECEQSLQNLLQKKSWLKALKLAIRMHHPLRCLTVLKELLLEDGFEKVVTKLNQLRHDQLLTLLEFAVHWNSNSKHCLVAQCVLRSVLEQTSPEELLQSNTFKNQIEKLLPYNERHLARMRRLKQYSTFADFVFAKMKLPNTE